MLTISSTKSAKPRKYIVRVGGDDKKEHCNKTELDGRDEVGSIEVDGNGVRNNDIAEE